MEIYQRSEAFVEKDGDLEFAFTKLILRGPNNEFFYTTTTDRIGASSPVDISQLQISPIPSDSIWPHYAPGLSLSPDPPPPNSYVKEPSLIDYGDTTTSLQLSSQILHEAKICELLKGHAHPNIATYIGCIVEGDRIKGLCFARYAMTLAQRLRMETPFDKERCLQGIESGIRHMHSLGLVHNDINPSNIMIDDADRPVIIDFDSCQHEGDKLGVKTGTWGWSIEGAEYAQRENDFLGLSKLKGYLESD
ncbi:serine/threonine kinase [Durotheca rogersii]|uniref:serine/threonine kinase n=1 Tax=Durotheca rogersii TaxID=419775 RepID=UPI00221FAB5A|nr:serine/threonine kinase [Durotheca rogersii]KAI5867860.1 serine/threonine kinase [Durotheca rogersii]